MTGSKRFSVNLQKPLIDFFGIPLLKHYRIVDAELARNFSILKKAMAYRISGHEIGIMNDLSPDNPTDSAVMKLTRKLMQEFTGSVKHFQSNLSRS